MKKFKLLLTYFIYIVLVTFLFFYDKNMMLLAVSFLLICSIPIIVLIKSGIIEHPINRMRGVFYGLMLSGIPKKLSVGEKFRIRNSKCVTMGKNCSVGASVRIMPLGHFAGTKYPSKIKIGNNVHIGDYTTIASMESVIIEDNVLFASYVHITDHSHEYCDINKAIMKQGVFSAGGEDLQRSMAWI